MDNKDLLLRLIKELKGKMPFTKRWADTAFQELTALISKEARSIGINTIRKIMTEKYIISDNPNKIHTLDTMAIFLGYENWTGFINEPYPEIKEPLVETANKDIDNSIKSLLAQLYDRNKSLSSAETIITADDNGNGTVTSTVFIQALSDIAIVKVQCYSTKYPIKVLSIDAREAMTMTKLCLYPFIENQLSYCSFVVFPTILTEGKNYRYIYTMVIKDYYRELVEDKYMIVERFVMNNRYSSIVEYYRFPDNDIYSTLVLKILSHPNKSLINKEISPTYKDGYKVYMVDYGDLHQIDVLVTFEVTL